MLQSLETEQTKSTHKGQINSYVGVQILPGGICVCSLNQVTTERIQGSNIWRWLNLPAAICNKRHKAPIKEVQRLNPPCQWITFENKDYAEMRINGTFFET